MTGNVLFELLKLVFRHPREKVNKWMISQINHIKYKILQYKYTIQFLRWHLIIHFLMLVFYRLRAIVMKLVLIPIWIRADTIRTKQLDMVSEARFSDCLIRIAINKNIDEAIA